MMSISASKNGSAFRRPRKCKMRFATITVGSTLSSCAAWKPNQRGVYRTPANCWRDRDVRSGRRVAGGERGAIASRSEPAALESAGDEEADRLFREVRRLLAGKQYDQVIDRLDVHRPAEWAVSARRAPRGTSPMGQAYLGRGDLAAARECLELLRDAQRRQPLLSQADYAAALSDLYRCCRL